jgi:beta-galactosidase
VLGTSVFVNAAVAGADQEVTDAHVAQTLGMPAPGEIALGIHSSLLQKGYAVGLVHPSDDLTDLELYVIPHWGLFDPAWVPNLTEWVNRGGVLVIGARTGTKDLNNHVISTTPPGVLSELAGITVEEFGKQNAPDERPLWVYLPGGECQSRHWYEVLQPVEGSGAEALAAWKGRHLNGLPAVSLRRVGQGAVIYVGTYLTADLFEALLPEIEKLRSIPQIWPFAAPGVQVSLRRGAEKDLWFFINTSDQDATIERVPGDGSGTDLVTGQPAAQPLTLPPNGVVVIQTTRAATPAV